MYISRDLPARIRELAEEIALKIYSFSWYETIYYSFWHADYFWLIKVFQHGSDHVGRPRNCVHTVLFHEQDVEEIPFFTLYDLDKEELFIHEKIRLENVGNHLKSCYFLSPVYVEDRILLLEEFSPSREDLEVYYNALISQHHNFILISSQKSPFLLRLLSGLLPYPSRLRLGVCTAFPTSNFSLPIHLFLITPRLYRKYYKRYQNQLSSYVVLDMESRSFSPNYPAANRLVEFVVENLFTSPVRVIKLLNFLEKFKVDRRQSNDMYANLMQAFVQTQGAIDALGNIEFSRAPGVWIQNLVKFAQAGYDNIALRVARDAVSYFKRRCEDATLEELEKRLVYLEENYGEFELEKESILAIICNLLREYLHQLSPSISIAKTAPPSGEDEVF
ncbi:MAG: hypothetical protein D6805_04055 [Planctomycetota bacterium]|nr:MAG: hypothetical protein D6805_04055 [Planctomycetota bacterium]